MKATTYFIVLFFIFQFNFIKAQNTTSNQYSLYGLGVENTNYFGGFNALGNTGTGYKSTLNINKSNPASLAFIPQNAFLYEIGLNGEYTNQKNSNTKQSNNNFNFTHIAFAFPIKENWGVNVGLIPYSKVNYEIETLQYIEGNSNQYLTNIIGSGGVNELFIGTGYKLFKNFTIGAEVAALFGNIEQEERIYVGNTETYFDRSKNYSGFNAKIGTQYQFKNKTIIGATVSFPSTLKGDQSVNGTKNIQSQEISIISESDNNINHFELPLKLSFGFSTYIKSNLLLSADYKINFWDNTDNGSNYSNQNIYGIGFEYKKSTNLANYWNRVSYKMGYNYNSGFISVSDKKIDTHNFSVGVGLPLSNKLEFSVLNISYTYGREGTLEKNLIIDNYHKLSLNLSLVGNWFQKRKIF